MQAEDPKLSIAPNISVQFSSLLSSAIHKANFMSTVENKGAVVASENALYTISNQITSISISDNSLLKRKVQCITEEGDRVEAEIGHLLQCKTFNNMWKDIADTVALDSFEFHVKVISTRIMTKVIDWCKNHAGKPDPIIERDQENYEHKWLELDEYENNFFKTNVEILTELLEAADYLDIPSLYLYGCQFMAALIIDKKPEEIRELLGLEDDLTEEDKATIHKKYVWCNF